MHKRLLSMVLALCILVGVLPTLSVTVSAADTEIIAPGYIDDNLTAGEKANDIGNTLWDLDNNDDTTDLSAAPTIPNSGIPNTNDETELTDPPPVVLINEEAELTESTALLPLDSVVTDINTTTASDPTIRNGVMPNKNPDYPFSGGNGSEEQPYLISTAADLAQLSANVKAGTTYSGKYFRMTAHIILNENVLASDGTLNGGTFYGWKPIGVSNNYYFSGNFDGDNHTISGIYINQGTSYQGLFGSVVNGTIKNIGVVDSYIKGSSYTGGIVGKCLGTVTNCFISGSVNGTKDRIGGIAGYISGTVANCSSSGIITGGSNDTSPTYGGGIVGSAAASATVTDCFNSSSIYGNNEVGGIVGKNEGTVTNCQNSGSITAGGQIGGIVGFNSGTVQYCYNTGAINHSKHAAGGIAGYNQGLNGTALIQYCYNLGSVTGGKNQCIGGIVGRNQANNGSAQVLYCYNTGIVYGGNHVGGLVGHNHNSKSKDTDICLVQYCYNASGISPKTGGGGCVGYNQSGSVLNCFYDKQLCMSVGIRDGDYTGQGEGRLTADMVGPSLSGSLGQDLNWTFEGDLYPRLAAMDSTDAAYVSTAPVFLSNNENASAVTADFSVGTGNSVTWASDNTAAINILSGSATVTRGDANTNVILTAKKNGVHRAVKVTVLALPAQDKPSASIDYINEQLTGLVAGAGYKINGTEYTADETGTIDIDSTWPGTTVFIIRMGDGKTLVDSPAQNLVIPARPATTGLTMNITKTDTTITIAAIEEAEYSKDNGSTWQRSNVFTGLAADTVYSMTIRYAATDTTFASDALESLPVRTNMVDKIKLQLTNITVLGKTYDKSVQADYTIADTIGLKLKPGETDVNHMADVSLFGTPVITFSDANAGEDKSISVAGVSLTGARAGFYELDFSNLTGTISPKPVHLAWTDHSGFVYDNTEKSISALVTNAELGDAAEVSGYVGTVSATDAGTYTADAATLSDSNYTLTAGNGISNEWTIAAATPVITLADKTVTKTGRPVTIDAAAVAGVAGGTTPDGSVTCIYYTDFACTTPTYAARENEGTAPVDIGTYYVKATIAASGNYGTNTSQAAKLIIKEEPVYSINGTVENDTDPATALSGVTIRVMSGATKVGLAATTGADGSFVLYGIPSGTYNLVAEYGEKTVTKIITVENADISLVSSIVMPSIVRNSILVVAGARTPDVVVGGLDTESESTPAENSVIITLTVAANESGAPANVVARTAAANGHKVGMVLDIDLSKIVDGKYDPNYSEASAPLKIIVPLPVELQGKATYRVYRYHNGSVDTITTAANEGGEYITVNADKTAITLHAKRFSTYAIGYTEPSHNTGHSTSYTITATANKGGAISPSSASVKAGGNKTFTIAADIGYQISDVLVDGQSVGAVSSYTFSNVRSKHAIEAFFAPDNASWVCPFVDAAETDWFYSAVQYVTVNGLMNGTGETTFAPDLKTTRAMIVTILWRMEGQPEAKELSSFTDVKDGTWYTPAIHWAAANEIVKGYDLSSFDPTGSITREQLATILYRYAKYKGYDVSVGEDTNILSYHDACDISEYAIPAIQWACGTGLINGRTEHTLVPQGSATRAETAAMLQRFSDNSTKYPFTPLT